MQVELMQFLANVRIVVLALLAQIGHLQRSQTILWQHRACFILKLWLAHADDQRDEFALGTVNATVALHGGQCQMLVTSCSASSAIVQRGVHDWLTTSHSPSRALPSTCEFMQSARIFHAAQV